MCSGRDMLVEDVSSGGIVQGGICSSERDSSSLTGIMVAKGQGMGGI